MFIQHRHPVQHPHALAFGVSDAEGVLGEGIALVGSEAKPSESL